MSPGSAPPPRQYIGEAPALMESAEASLRALLQPGAVFGELRFRPGAPPTQSLLLLAFWVAAGNILAVTAVLMQHPGAGPLPLAAGLAGATAVLVPLLLLGAVLLHVLAVLSGGREGFARSLQLYALLAGLYPLGTLAVFAPLPLAALAPTLYGTYLFVQGVALMHSAPAAQAWIVVGLCGLFSASGQLLFQQRIQAMQSRMETLASLYSADPMAALSASGRPEIEAPVLYSSQGALPPAVPENAGVAALAEAGRSGLDMIGRAGGPGGLPYAPRGDGSAAGPAGAGEPMRQATQMGSAVMGMINQQLAADPKALDSLPPQQRQQLLQLMQMANQMTSQLQGGRTPSPQQRERMRALMRQMGVSAQADGAQDPPSAPPRRRAPAAPSGPAYE